jgi:hypothetical protein
MNISHALSNDLLHLVKRDDRRLVYHMQFGELKSIVKFRLIPLGGRHYDCMQSHYVRTAIQCHPYISSHTSFEGKGYTLYRAVSKFTFYYVKAVESGHDPQEDWLSPRRSS